MRIYYVSNSNIPSRSANSVAVMKMCHAFSINGHDVTLFADKGPERAKDVYDFYGTANQFRIVRYPFGSKYKLLRKLWLTHGLVARTRRDRPDLLYGRAAARLLACAPLGTPIVYEAHATPTSPANEAAEKALFSSTALVRVVAISAALAEEYRTRFPALRDKQVITAHSGADPLSAPTACPEPAQSPDRMKVGYVGHLFEGKGIEIIAQIAPRCLWADFHIVGGALEDISSWKSRLPSTENIIFHGFVPPSEVARLLQSFDVVLAPFQRKILIRNRANKDIGGWTSPLKLFEYMAAGKPIICSNLPVIAEVMVDRENALLVEPEDIGAWSAALEELHSDVSLRARLGGNARERFEAEFTWRKRAEKVLRDLPFEQPPAAAALSS